MLDHCGLAIEDGFLEATARRIRFPGYYEPAFSDEERAVIDRETGPTARRFGYGSAPAEHPASQAPQ